MASTDYEQDIRHDSVRNWYMETFPDDELGTLIDPHITFERALDAVSLGGGFYDVLGVGDSVVRERVFDALAEKARISRDSIYDAWIEKSPISEHPTQMIGSEERDMSVKTDEAGMRKCQYPERQNLPQRCEATKPHRR